MLYGNKFGEFTERERALIREAEGIPVRRRSPARGHRRPPPRPNPQPRTHQAADAGLTFFLAILISAGIAGVLGDLHKEGQAKAAASTGASQITPPKAPLKQRENHQEETRQSGRPAPPTREEDLLPQGWELGVAREEIPLFEAPHWNAPRVVSLPAGTEFLLRRANHRGHAWHVVIPESGQIWGYASITPGASQDDSTCWPLPEGWIRARYEGTRPANIYEIGLSRLRVKGYIPPNTEVVMHPVANLDLFLVITESGSLWGYSQLELRR